MWKELRKILGKHSEIYVDSFSEDYLKVLVEDDQDFIDKFKRYNCATGYNPLKYIE